MTTQLGQSQFERLPTYIPGFDQVARGGLPKGRTTLLSGMAGSAKTIFAAQFLAEGIRHGDKGGVFVTFEETPEDIRRNLSSLGWDICQWEQEKKWMFVDASPRPGETDFVTGPFDLGALLARTEHAVNTVDAERVVIDSIGSIFTQFTDSSPVRSEFFRMGAALKLMGVTAIITAERTDENGELSRFGVEEFVADNVIVLRNKSVAHKRRRTLEILKFRGADHEKGEFPFTIRDGEGIIVLSQAVTKDYRKAADVRITTGNRDLDEMLNGGLFGDSITLLSGATGTGKTLIVTEFIAGGALNGERSLMFAFEESREQLYRNARSWGVDFEMMEERGVLKIVSIAPETAGLEDHLVMMQKMITQFRPQRLAIDSLTALERISTPAYYRDFIIRLSSFIKQHRIAALYTSAAPDLLGGAAITASHISSITDVIILIRYVEIYGEMRRSITVLKMRGSLHDKGIREFSIDEQGMHVGKALRNISGILSGHSTHLASNELERMEELFQPEGFPAPAPVPELL